MSDRHSSISVKSADLITVTVVTSQGCPPVTFQCPREQIFLYIKLALINFLLYLEKSSVSYVLEKTSYKRKDSSKLPKEFILKVCGRDEYLEK